MLKRYRIDIQGEIVGVVGKRVENGIIILEADYSPLCGNCPRFKLEDMLGAGFCDKKKKMCFCSDNCRQV